MSSGWKVITATETVDSAGTAQAVVTSEVMTHSVEVSALDANTGDIYVGGSNVSSTNTIGLSAGETVTITAPTTDKGPEMLDLSTVFIDADTSTEGVSLMYLAKKN
jgi:large exoprotein involved in heme utilization and adhesion